MTGTRTRSVGARLRGLRWQVAALTVAATLTVALSQATASGAFAGRTGDAANKVTAAANLCTAPGLVAASLVADTGISQEFPATNFSTNATVGVVSDSGRVARSLLKFDLPTRPAGCVFVSAALQLRVASGSSGASIEVYRAATAWVPGTVSWNTRPGVTGTAVSVASSSSGGTVLTWPVTDHVTVFRGGTNHGFVVKDSLEGSGSRTQLFDSMEAGTTSHRPKLLITWG